MELVLPNQYVEIHQEEMMYLDGGDWNNFSKNIQGLYKRSAGLRSALQSTGLVTSVGNAVWANQAFLISRVSTLSAKVIVGAGLIGVAIVGIVGTALWNMRLFY